MQRRAKQQQRGRFEQDKPACSLLLSLGPSLEARSQAILCTSMVMPKLRGR